MAVDLDLQIVEQALERLSALDIERALELMSDDFLLELPFCADGGPRSLAGDAAKKFMRALPKLLSKLSLTDVVVHGKLPDGTVVAEYRSDGTPRSGRPYCNAYIGLRRVRDGRLVWWREYYDPNVITTAFPEG